MKNKVSLLDKLLIQAESNIKRNRIILFFVIAFVEVILIVISCGLRWFSISEFFINVINNIIGILPPILLFDFFYEKISNDATSVEMSRRITSAMMGKPETLKLFNIEDRKKFLWSTINSVISDEDLTDMILDNVNRYVIDPSQLDVQIRKEFNYDFELKRELPKEYNMVLEDTSEYYYIQEILRYKAKHFVPEGAEKQILQEVKIGFMFDNDCLDKALRNDILKDENVNEQESHFVFSESLDLLSDDQSRLCEYLKNDSETKEKKAGDFFRLSLRINGRDIDIKEVVLSSAGVIFIFDTKDNIIADEYSIRIIFSIPKRWGSVIEATLVDPTYAPRITLSYPREYMTVDIYPYMNKSKSSSISTAHERLNGIFDISLDEWVYPMSGIVFSVEKRDI